MANVVTLIESLSNRAWNYATAPATMNFSTFPPGVYVLVNSSAGAINVNVMGQGFVVPAHSRWNFQAHPDMASVRLQHGAQPLGQQRAGNIAENVPTDAGVIPGRPAPVPPDF